MEGSLLNKTSVCIITGASRGLGRSIAVKLAQKLAKNSLFILLARNETLLMSVSDQLKQHDVTSVTAVFDQGSQNQSMFDNIIQDCLNKAQAKPADFEQAILINNAGTLECLEYARSLDQLTSTNSYLSTNITGCVVLTAKFLQTFTTAHVKNRVIINISSLAAVAPMKSWLLYCMVKSSRDMMMKVVAEEEDHIRTLNYAPGPLATDMIEVASRETQDDALRKWFQDQVENKTLVDCDMSVEKLLKILQTNTFENGAHVDYYDEV